MYIPSREWTMTTLEVCVLVSLLKAVRPLSAFEYGTYLGETTRLIAANLTAENGVVHTLDIERLEGIVFQGVDEHLAQHALKTGRSFDEFDRSGRIVQLLGDSYDFDPTPYEKQVQFVLIDGNHHIKYAQKDTENGLKMLADDQAVIVWHDYQSPQFPELTAYLENLSARIPINHVEDTMLAFHIRGVEICPHTPRSVVP
jgi:predicted O-methyltransferase YrrM